MITEREKEFIAKNIILITRETITYDLNGKDSFENGYIVLGESIGAEMHEIRAFCNTCETDLGPVDEIEDLVEHVRMMHVKETREVEEIDDGILRH